MMRDASTQSTESVGDSASLFWAGRRISDARFAYCSRFSAALISSHDGARQRFSSSF
jgi:hypothetical protein